MKRLGTALLLLVLLTAGCTKQAKQETPAPQKKEALPQAVPPAKIPLRPLPAEQVIGMGIETERFQAFFSPAEFGDLIQAVVQGYNQADTASRVEVPDGLQTVHIYLTDDPDWTLTLHRDGSVGTSTMSRDYAVRSPALTEALQKLISHVILFEGDPVSRVAANLNDDWVQVEPGKWTNKAKALVLMASARRKGVVLDQEGRWMPPKEYLWGGMLEPWLVQVRGGDHLYTGLQYQAIPETTGGGFWGTVPHVLDLYGKAGGLSLSCNSTVWQEGDLEAARAAQAVVDAECPALLERFTVDLGEPLEPTATLLPVTAPSLTQTATGFHLRLALAQSGTWQWPLAPHLWQVRSGERAWLLDLANGSLRQAPPDWPGASAIPLPDGPLPDGRLIGTLADGRAVAQLGYQGALIVWRPEAPTQLDTLVDAALRPAVVTISPDGKRLVYFPSRNDAQQESVATYFVETGQTVVTPLRGPSSVYGGSWTAAGELHFVEAAQSAMVSLITRDGERRELLPLPEGARFVGVDGCGLLYEQADALFRQALPACMQSPAEPERLAKPGRWLRGNGLIGLPQAGSLVVIETGSGVRYTAEEPFGLPVLPLPWQLELGPVPPESGYVAVRVATAPHEDWVILKVKPE